MARKPNAAFMRPKTLSPELEAVVGKGPMPTTEVMKKVWVYIKKNDLQNAKDKRLIDADEKLKAVFGQPQVHMLKMAGILIKHQS